MLPLHSIVDAVGILGLGLMAYKGGVILYQLVVAIHYGCSYVWWCAATEPFSEGKFHIWWKNSQKGTLDKIRIMWSSFIQILANQPTETRALSGDNKLGGIWYGSGDWVVGEVRGRRYHVRPSPHDDEMTLGDDDGN